MVGFFSFKPIDWSSFDCRKKLHKQRASELVQTLQSKAPPGAATGAFKFSKGRVERKGATGGSKEHPQPATTRAMRSVTPQSTPQITMHPIRPLQRGLITRQAPAGGDAAAPPADSPRCLTSPLHLARSPSKPRIHPRQREILTISQYSCYLNCARPAIKGFYAI